MVPDMKFATLAHCPVLGRSSISTTAPRKTCPVCGVVRRSRRRRRRPYVAARGGLTH
jgi:hypothetical protein